MSRKLYLDDSQVAALQDALKPLEGQSADLDRAIQAVMGLRRSTPKNWGYRTVAANGRSYTYQDAYSDPALSEGVPELLHPQPAGPQGIR